MRAGLRLVRLHVFYEEPAAEEAIAASVEWNMVRVDLEITIHLNIFV